MIGLATCAALPDLDEDGPLLVDALARRGLAAEPAVWDDPRVEWARYELVVVRSTWDYPPRRAAFLAWARALPRVRNPADVLAWNTHKTYLRDLARAGVPVVPTEFIPPGRRFRPPPGEYVVKPSVSVGSRDAARYAPGERERPRAHIERLHRDGRVAMVQPYVESIDARGETAVIFLGGSYSHAIRKGPLLAPGQGFEEGLFRAEDVSPREPSSAERAAAERALDAVPGGRRRLLYARVDVVEGPGGEPLVLELELAEPSLFLIDGAHAGAADRLAARVAAELGA